MRNRDLAKLLVQNSYIELPAGAKPFVLASGKESRHYFDCQATTMLAEAMPLIGRAFLEKIRETKANPQSVGGLTRGADPIAQAVAMVSEGTRDSLNAFSVRKAPKDHGTSRLIEGFARTGMRVAIVDDVITTGGSVIQAIRSCKEAGLEIVQVIVLVDREEGGLANIQEKVPNVPVSSLFTYSDLMRLRQIENGNGAADETVD